MITRSLIAALVKTSLILFALLAPFGSAFANTICDDPASCDYKLAAPSATSSAIKVLFSGEGDDPILPR